MCEPTPIGGSALPRVTADLVLVHAPAFFDFRHCGDVYFPYLGTSGDVPITPLYEFFPLGWKTLQQYLEARGRSVRILNLATALLIHPRLDVRALFGAIDAKVIGIDLHWMVHVQGSLAIAALAKSVRPDVPILFGGISATHYARELASRPEVDLVMRGYDTHAPVAALLDALCAGDAELDSIPNLVWKRGGRELVDNGLSHAPSASSLGIDWRTLPPPVESKSMPINELMCVGGAGCAHACGWCGGSRDAFRRVYGTSHGMAHKPIEEATRELGSIGEHASHARYHLYTIGAYNEPAERLGRLLDGVAAAGVKSVSYEQFHLTPDDVLRRMVAANPRTSITLSPESHDPAVAKLAGRGVYTNDEMEAWIERALDLGIREIDVWYFVGMPGQDERSVMETVDYCGRLLERFRDRRVVPLICPMIPMLDPASTFFEEPERHGYRVFSRTLEEHRRAMGRASLINRINYETRWLSREELVRVGYRAVRRLAEMKADARQLPRFAARSVARKIDDALDFLGAVHRADCIEREDERARELGLLAGEIRRRNDEIFSGSVANQAFPLDRRIGGRWFDETLWSHAELAAAEAHADAKA